MSFENGFEISNGHCFKSKCCFDADISFQGQKQLSDAMSNPYDPAGTEIFCFPLLKFKLSFANISLPFMKPHN